MYMYACICMCVCMCVYVSVYVCICVYAYMYMYVCIIYGGNCPGGNVLPKTGGGGIVRGIVRGQRPGELSEGELSYTRTFSCSADCRHVLYYKCYLKFCLSGL